MIWPITVTAKSTKPNGRTVTMSRTIDGVGDCDAAMLRALLSRKDKGRYFIGEEVRAITPLGKIIIREFDPDTQTLKKVPA